MLQHKIDDRYLYKSMIEFRCIGCDDKAIVNKEYNWNFIIIETPFRASGWYCPSCSKKLEKDKEGKYINQNNFNLIRAKIELGIGKGLK